MCIRRDAARRATHSPNPVTDIFRSWQGTGKTIQTIAFLAFLRENGIHGFNLVVVPRAVLGNWEIEFARFAPSMPILVYQGTPPQRKALREEMRALAQGDAEHQPTVITTYDFARRDKNLLARATSKDKSHFAYQVLVIDEAQNIKSASTKLVTFERIDRVQELTCSALQDSPGSQAL